MLSLLDETDRARCQRLMEENAIRFAEAWGSSHNHQAWPGGYMEHVEAVMRIAIRLYHPMDEHKRLNFSLKDALLVLFLHDLEKPWRNETGKLSKADRRKFRAKKILEYGFTLTETQWNALRYVEGEGDDYRPDKRVMNELGAFCHMCDVASARIWWG